MNIYRIWGFRTS